MILDGILEAELTGADLPGSLGQIAGAGIAVMEAVPSGPLSLRLRFRRQDRKRLEALCKKQGDSLRILGRQGLYWSIRRLLGRPVLIGGLGLILALTLFLPTRVLFIRVEGNERIPANQILEAAEGCGLRFGINRRRLRSEQVKNALLEKIPELRWAGVNTRGCTAVISVREGREAPTMEARFPGIAAAMDGIVESCTATSGTLLCKPGDAVTRGQLLISCYTDAGLCIRADGAQGEIVARTSRTFSAVTPGIAALRGKEIRTKRHYSLLIGKNRINFGKYSGIRGGSCDRMYEEYYITLPGGFQLPIALAVDTCTEYTLAPVSLSPEEAEASLSRFASRSLTREMIAGSILSAAQSVTHEGGLWRLQGTYLCREMIGRPRQEQIGE